MAFKMKGPSLYRSPLRKDKTTYDEAWNNMESSSSKKGEFKNNPRSGKMYTNDEYGYAQFVNEAKDYNAKKNANTPKKIETKKVTKVEVKTAKPELKKALTEKEVRKARRKAVADKIFGSGSKRKANEENKKKRQSRSVTGRMKAKASKFGRMGT